MLIGNGISTDLLDEEGKVIELDVDEQNVINQWLFFIFWFLLI